MAHLIKYRRMKKSDIGTWKTDPVKASHPWCLSTFCVRPPRAVLEERTSVHLPSRSFSGPSAPEKLAIWLLHRRHREAPSKEVNVEPALFGPENRCPDSPHGIRGKGASHCGGSRSFISNTKLDGPDVSP